MNSKERIFTALSNNIPDRVPMLEFSIDPVVIDKIYKGYDYFDFVEKVGLDAVRVGQQFSDLKSSCRLIDEEKGIIVDKWGIGRQFTREVLWIATSSPIQNKDDLINFKPPDPEEIDVLGRLPEVVKRFKHKKAIVYALNDAFLIPSELRGMENLLMDYILNPDLAQAVTNLCVEYSLIEVERAIDAGADVIMLRDDYASRNGTIMSPEYFKKFILPGLSKIVSKIKEKGAFCIKHCDGNIWNILDDIVETGVDAINPLEPAAGMDIGKVKKKYGEKVCLIGNVDCGDLLCRMEEDKVIEEVRHCIREAGPSGGYILSSSNSITSSTKPKNFMAMIESTKKYGKYPLIFNSLKGRNHKPLG